MEKPITIRITEFDQKLADLINESDLPRWKVFDEIQKMVAQLQTVVQREAQLEAESWRKFQEEQKEKEKEQVK